LVDDSLSGGTNSLCERSLGEAQFATDRAKLIVNNQREP